MWSRRSHTGGPLDGKGTRKGLRHDSQRRTAHRTAHPPSRARARPGRRGRRPGRPPRRPRAGGAGAHRAVRRPVTVTMWHIWDTTASSPSTARCRCSPSAAPNLRRRPHRDGRGPRPGERAEDHRRDRLRRSPGPADGQPGHLRQRGRRRIHRGPGPRPEARADQARRVVRGGLHLQPVEQEALRPPRRQQRPPPPLLQQSLPARGRPGRGQAPPDWEDLQQASRQLTRRQGEQFERTGWQPGAGTFEWLIFGLGGRVFSADGKKAAFGAARASRPSNT